MNKYVSGGVHCVSNTLLTDAEATFYNAVEAAEAAYQVADRSTPALAKTASITKHRAIKQAADVAGSAGVSAGHLGGPSRAALMELGTGGS